MKERKLPELSFIKEWKHRLEHPDLKRLKIEWQRYLPPALQSKDLETHILNRVQWAAERIFS